MGKDGSGDAHEVVRVAPHGVQVAPCWRDGVVISSSSPRPRIIGVVPAPGAARPETEGCTATPRAGQAARSSCAVDGPEA